MLCFRVGARYYRIPPRRPGMLQCQTVSLGSPVSAEPRPTGLARRFPPPTPGGGHYLVRSTTPGTELLRALRLTTVRVAGPISSHMDWGTTWATPELGGMYVRQPA